MEEANNRQVRECRNAVDWARSGRDMAAMPIKTRFGNRAVEIGQIGFITSSGATRKERRAPLP